MDQDDARTLEVGIKSAKVASFVGITQIASIAISGALLIILARLLGPDEYGIYTLAFGVSAFFGAFRMMGLEFYLNRFIPQLVERKKKEELKQVVGTSFFVLFGISIAAVLIGVLFGGAISVYAFHSPAYAGLIDVALFSIVPLVLMYLAYNTLIGFRDAEGASATYLVANISIAAAGIILVIAGYKAMGAILGIIIGSVVGLLVGLYFIRKHSEVSISFGGMSVRIRKMLDFFLPIAIATTLIPGLMNNFAVIFLGIFSLHVIVGSFGIAYRIGTIFSTVLSFISAVLVQMFSSVLINRNSKRNVSRLYNYSLYFGVLLAAPMAVFLVALPHAFVNTLFPGYNSSLLYIPALSLSILIGIIGAYASPLAISMGKVKKVLKYAALIGLVQLILLFVLVPILNVYGIIFGVYLAGSLVADYLYIGYMRRIAHVKTEFGKIYRIIVASAILALLLLPVNMVNVRETVQLLIGAMVVLLLYPPLLGITGALKREEIGLLRAIAKQLPVVGRLFGVFLSYTSSFVR